MVIQRQPAAPYLNHYAEWRYHTSGSNSATVDDDTLLFLFRGPPLLLCTRQQFHPEVVIGAPLKAGRQLQNAYLLRHPELYDCGPSPYWKSLGRRRSTSSVSHQIGTQINTTTLTSPTKQQQWQNAQGGCHPQCHHSFVDALPNRNCSSH